MRTVQSLLGHADIMTAVIDLHVMKWTCASEQCLRDLYGSNASIEPGQSQLERLEFH